MTYEDAGFCSFRNEEDGPELMANFVATILRETRIVDGITQKSMLLIGGEGPILNDDGSLQEEPYKYPAVEITAEEFAGMSWVMPNWGVRAVIRPGAGIKDDLRTFIQLRSTPELVTVYRHTGWTKINGKDVYLHAGGGVGKKGNDKNVQVRLPNELSRYDLSSSTPPVDAVKASLALVGITKPDITWPLLAAAVAPMFGQVDYAVHLAGRTGTYKSELVSLFQSLYGAKMDARNLPGSWSSTANALEAQAFLACNAPFVVDDFVPQGSAWQQRSYQMNADKLIRAQGNQAGRARLTDVSSLQQTMYPRGIVLSTGEDIPEGHSVRARLMILELSPGDISLPALTSAQKNRAALPGAMQALAQYLADENLDLTPRKNDLRTSYQDIGHSRTPGMLGSLVTVAEAYLEFANSIGAIDANQYAKLRKESKSSIEMAGNRQNQYLEDADPIEIFVSSIRQVLGSGLGHVRSMNGGVPKRAVQLGWIEERSGAEMATFKSRGPTIGWASSQNDELYLDITVGLAVIKKVAGQELPLTKQTLFKRMKEAGVLTRADESRQRNTVRITADGHVRNVLALGLGATLDSKDAGPSVIGDDDGE